MMAHVHHVMKDCDLLPTQTTIPSDAWPTMASMLLATSRFSDMMWKNKALRYAKGLLRYSSDCYLLACVAHRESALLRISGKIEESNKALEAFIHSTIFPGHDQGLEADARWNAQRGNLICSFAENLIHVDSLGRAKDEVCEWRPLTPNSSTPMERPVVWSKNILLGKIIRLQGHFSEALPYFESLLEESATDEYFESTGWHRTILCNVADLYSELNREVEAEGILTAELKRMTDWHCENIPVGRRLQLSTAEALLRRGFHDKAEGIFEKLMLVYDAIDKPSTSTINGIFRMWAGLARLSHMRNDWNEASQRWRQALKVVEDCDWQDGFNASISRLSLAHVYKELGDLEESSGMLMRAKSYLDKQGPKFGIVGLGSYWYEYVDGLLAAFP